MAKPKAYTLNGKSYALVLSGMDDEGNCLATVECDGVAHHNLIGRNWREFIDSYLAVNQRVNP